MEGPDLEMTPPLFREQPLFGGEFAPPEEKPKARARTKPKQKSLFKVKRLRRAHFLAQGLDRFDNVNTWLTRVQPFVERGYVIEYGHEAGRNGWARVAEIKKRRRGRLISNATAPDFVKSEPIQGELPAVLEMDLIAPPEFPQI